MKRIRKHGKGIALKIAAYTSLVTLLALACTLVLQYRAQIGADRDEENLRARLQQVEMARILQVTFKKQVQEWKDILLRGQDPNDLEKYRKAFFTQEGNVQSDARTLLDQISQTGTKARIATFLEMHQVLGQHYRAALDVFVADGKFDYRRADRSVRGEDRPLTDSIDEMVKAIGVDFDAYQTAHAAAVVAEKRYTALGAAVLFSFFMWGGLRIARRIITPILELSEVMSRVTHEQDYTLRAERRTTDEVGLLADGFNAMLDRIQSQNAARKRADEALEASRRKLEDIIHSVDGIVWEADAQTLDFTFVSHKAEKILGYPREQWTSEPRFWLNRLHPADRQWASEFCRTAITEKRAHEFEYRMTAADGRVVWVNDIVTVICEDGKAVALRGIMVDTTERKVAAEQLASTHKQLMKASRQAGMAEVATSVLHNVGNVLNSVSVSAEVVGTKVRQFRVGSLQNLAQMLSENSDRLADFLVNDPRGKAVPGYMVKLADSLAEPQKDILEELDSLRNNIEHIKEVVATQQSYGHRSGVLESLSAVDVIEDAIQINDAGLVRHEIQLIREYGEVQPLVTDRHKMMQILVNLLGNAKHALDGAGPQRTLTVRLALKTPEMIEIVVADNGMGIAADNLTRIFQHGFTTKKGGHGYGLHSGALAARELGGSLTAQSAGPGHGAAFTLELPVNPTKLH